MSTLSCNVTQRTVISCDFSFCSSCPPSSQPWQGWVRSTEDNLVCMWVRACVCVWTSPFSVVLLWRWMTNCPALCGVCAFPPVKTNKILRINIYRYVEDSQWSCDFCLWSVMKTTGRSVYWRIICLLVRSCDYNHFLGRRLINYTTFKLWIKIDLALHSYWGLIRK